MAFNRPAYYDIYDKHMRALLDIAEGRKRIGIDAAKLVMLIALKELSSIESKSDSGVVADSTQLVKELRIELDIAITERDTLSGTVARLRNELDCLHLQLARSDADAGDVP